MNGFSTLRGRCAYFEIGTCWVKGVDGDGGFEFALERQPDGRLTPDCKQKLGTALKQFVKRKAWQPSGRAICAVGASGVSLRRLSVPAAGRDQFQRLLLLQIEKEFPLPPDELAWGCRPLDPTHNHGSLQQELLVVAVKKERLQDYAEVFTGAGLEPVFTLAALARSRLCRPPLGTCALLDVAPGAAETIVFNQGVPAAIRTFMLNGDDAVATRETADFLVQSGFGALGGKLFLSGKVSPARELLEQRFGRVEMLEVPAGLGYSAAVAGLKKAVEVERDSLLCFQTEAARKAGSLEPGAVRKWAAAAIALALGLCLLPYVQALVLKPYLGARLAAIKAQTGKLTAIDQELGFFEFLKQNQPPYLDALFLCAKAAPSGSRFDSLTMNRRGELQMRGSMRNADQVSEFRSKLVDSGFFSSVSVEDQSPTPDRQKVNIRITAQWRPYNQRVSLVIGPGPQELAKDKTKK